MEAKTLITLIIPAYNESENLPQVLEVVTRVSMFERIVVVDDGSIDDTYSIAMRYGVDVIRLPYNQGKGAAIAVGARAAATPFVALLDADLIGLQERHIQELALPVINEDAVMSLGLFSSGRLRTDWAQKVAPGITGQRVLRRELLLDLPGIEQMRFGVDLALTRHIQRRQLPIAKVYLDDVTQRMKEEKIGWLRGTSARMKMYWDILRVMKK